MQLYLEEQGFLARQDKPESEKHILEQLKGYDIIL